MRALKQRNSKKVRKEIIIVRANKMIRKGDLVQVIAGKEAAAKKTGKVLKIFTDTNRCLVEKVNMVKRHRKPTQSTPGGIDEKESSIHLSNVKFISRGTTETKKTGTKKSATKTATAAKKKTSKG